MLVLPEFHTFYNCAEKLFMKFLSRSWSVLRRHPLKSTSVINVTSAQSRFALAYLHTVREGRLEFLSLVVCSLVKPKPSATIQLSRPLRFSSPAPLSSVSLRLVRLLVAFQSLDQGKPHFFTPTSLFCIQPKNVCVVHLMLRRMLLASSIERLPHLALHL